MFIRLALLSLINRKSSVALTFLAITVSVLVLFGVEQIRQQAKSSFGSTVSGIDLIVGARTGDISLLLYSVFRLGNATSNISWQSYQTIANNPKVAWTIPISLGDSHKGYRVMGTSLDYFTHFHYGQQQALAFASGKAFADTYDVVLGSRVAEALGYQLGDQLVLAHGIGATSFSEHKDSPFRVSGILKPTGTPVDETLHIRLAGMEAIHKNWRNGVPIPQMSSPRTTMNSDLTPESITAFMVGLKSKLATFQLQRQINTATDEPLLAILPGVTLTQLWQTLSAMEDTLRLIAALVLLASLLGLAAMLLATIRERQQEIAVMRILGASPGFIFALIEAETLVITVVATLAGYSLLSLLLVAGNDWLAGFGLFIDINQLLTPNINLLGMVIGSAAVIGFLPAYGAYRKALHMQLG